MKGAGGDYDFYDTKHKILHTIEKSDMPQLSNPKLLGSGEIKGEVLEKIKKAYKIKAEPIFTSDTSKGFMYRVSLRKGKQIGWTCKTGRDVAFYDLRSRFLLKIPQRKVPKLSVGERSVLWEVRRCYKAQKHGVRMKRVKSSRAKFKYKIVEQTEKVCGCFFFFLFCFVSFW